MTRFHVTGSRSAIGAQRKAGKPAGGVIRLSPNGPFAAWFLWAKRRAAVCAILVAEDTRRHRPCPKRAGQYLPGSSVTQARRAHMRNSTASLITLATAAALSVLTAFAQPAVAQESQATYRDIEQTLGFLPGFFKQLPESAITGAW